MGRTFYEILGVSRTADEKEIRAAFLCKARMYHPDMAAANNIDPKQAEELMKLVSLAFDVLKDPEKRSLYDRCLQEGRNFTVEWSRWVHQKAAAKAYKQESSSFTRKKPFPLRKEEDEGGAEAVSIRPQMRQETGRRVRTTNSGKIIFTATSATRPRDEMLGYMLLAGLRVVKENIVQLRPQARWKEDEAHPFFDLVLDGRHNGEHYRIFMKAYTTFSLDELEELTDYAQDEEPERKLLLIREFYSFIVLAKSIEEGVEIRERIKAYNSTLLNLRRGQTHKAIALIPFNKGLPFVPFSHKMQPPIGELKLKLT